MRSVKIKIELNPDMEDDDTSVTIHAKSVTPEVEQIYRQLQGINEHPDQIEGKKDNVSYYLSMNEILFFETEDKQVIAHTARDAFTVDYKLYELENLLNNQFMRVSKSTIL
ncbi:MAG: LytTR family transcriptional regulator, partial [Lactobacillus sp.]|nr:LytTR family transcriptional regulator [Lactobacillus sp.]